MDATETFREALREVTDTSVEKIAEEAGYSRSSFDQYANRRPPSRAAIRALASVLSDRAERLREYAERLEAAGDEGPGGDSPGSRR